MTTAPLGYDNQLEEIQRLRTRLEEAEATIAAIRDGNIDAVMVYSPQPTLYTLEGAEKPYRILVESMQQGVAIISSDETLLFCNPYLANLLGTTVSDLVGRELNQLFDCGSTASWVAELKACESSQIKKDVTIRNRLGVVVSLEASLQILPHQQFALIVTDVSQKKQVTELLASQAALLDSREALRQRAEELQTLLDTIPLGIFISQDTHCHTMSGNKTLREMLRVSIEQNVSKTAPAEEQPTHFQVFRNGQEVQGEDLPAQRAARGEVVCFDELEVRFNDNTKIDVLVFAAPLFDPQGSPRGSVGGLLDITDRKQIEDRLRLTNERFQVALKGTNIMVFNQDLDLRYTWVHDPILGSKTEQFLGKRDTDLFERSEDGATTESIKRRVLETGESQHQEVCVRYQGKDRFYDLRVDPTYSADGKINGITCAAIDVTDRKLIETSLKDMDRRKNEFLATLAHELRNPLAPLRNGLQLMELACDDPVMMDDVRTMMTRQLSQLVRLVDDLLDLSRISQGKISLDLKPTSLEEVIKSAVETSKPLLDEFGHTLSLSLPIDVVYVNADLTRLAQVFLNLLNNAAKYSEKGSAIELMAKVVDQEVVVEIRDHGIGISTDGLKRVFDMFSQVDSSLTRSRGGLGIGLSLVKQLVEMHGGRVEAKSEGTGCGSTFVVYLPAVGGHASDEQNTESLISKTAYRILVVDDNRDNANTLAIVLSAMGHTVHTAFDGEEALDAFEKSSPDIVLLDIGLPKLDGYEVCRSIRQRCGDKKVVVIAQSGWGQEEDRLQSNAAGFDHHLIKPVELTTLNKVMNDLWMNGNSK